MLLMYNFERKLLLHTTANNDDAPLENNAMRDTQFLEKKIIF